MKMTPVLMDVITKLMRLPITAMTVTGIEKFTINRSHINSK